MIFWLAALCVVSMLVCINCAAAAVYWAREVRKDARRVRAIVTASTWEPIA